MWTTLAGKRGEIHGSLWYLLQKFLLHRRGRMWRGARRKLMGSGRRQDEGSTLPLSLLPSLWFSCLSSPHIACSLAWSWSLSFTAIPYSSQIFPSTFICSNSSTFIISTNLHNATPSNNTHAAKMKRPWEYSWTWVIFGMGRRDGDAWIVPLPMCLW